MAMQVTREMAPAIAAHELNCLLGAGLLPRNEFEAASAMPVATPVYDTNGQILFYRVPISRRRESIAFADIAAFPGLGALLLRVSQGFPWNEDSMYKSALAAAKKGNRQFKFDAHRFVAHSYPKMAVQFLLGGNEVAMIDIGSWHSVPDSISDRWSFIDHLAKRTVSAKTRSFAKALHRWSRMSSAVHDAKRGGLRQLRLGVPKSLMPLRILVPSLERVIQYSPLNKDHYPCYELRTQPNGNWCGIASMQMLLDFYRYHYDQYRMAAKLGLGEGDGVRLTAFPNYLQTLSNGALETDIDYRPSWTAMVKEVNANHPVISVITPNPKNPLYTHARTVAGFMYGAGPRGSLIRFLKVYDPWPANAGLISYENFDAVAYDVTVTAHLKYS